MTTIADTVKDATTRPKERRGLEAQADFVRARLVRRLDALLERKRHLLNPVEELQQHAALAVAVSAGAALLLGTGVAVLAYRVSTRKERARRARWAGWLRLVTHPERVTPKSHGFLRGVAEKSVSAVVAASLAAAAKHLISELAEHPLSLPAPLTRRLPPSPDPFPSPHRP
jgi:hypothetical protein